MDNLLIAHVIGPAKDLMRKRGLDARIQVEMSHDSLVLQLLDDKGQLTRIILSSRQDALTFIKQCVECLRDSEEN